VSENDRGLPARGRQPVERRGSADHLLAGIVDIPIIMGMPPHMIIMGVPMFIMLFIISQRSRIMSIMDGLAGFIFIIMPSGIISHET
jgi:hypothetical protein